MSFAYAEIIVDVPARRVDRTFTYAVPGDLQPVIREGMRVKVPFGPRRVEGFVVGLVQSTDVEGVKEITEVIDREPVVTSDLLQLARWMSEYYMCTYVDALHSILPRQAGRMKPKTLNMINPGFSRSEINQWMEKLTPKQAKVVKILAEKAGLDNASLAQKAGVTTGVITTLKKKGIISQYTVEFDRDPYKGRHFEPTTPVEPTLEQREVLREIYDALEKNKGAAFLLHGVTGSGKTEVYLQAIAQCIKMGKQAIVLVPEISLTPQTVERFKSRFGDRVAVMHSRLSQGERNYEWSKIRRGAVDMVIGARSAIFAPFARLGMIIIDEEHENTYKQEDNPRYHAREVAKKRSELTNCLVILGSATPALESYYEASQGNYRLLKMRQRVDNRKLPEVEVIDLREELKEGNRTIFSNELNNKIQERLDKKEQIILFLNRRGFSTFVVCRECGLVLKCPNCDIALTYHQSGEILQCHYCNYKRANPDICPKCGSKHIRYFGIGTQKVEEEVHKIFPQVRTIRMDVDTTGHKGAHEELLASFKAREADILIGTQMIAKGLDIPNVTLVGVITADTALNLPDFRAGERTFQLMTQVAGRAGRGNVPGEVVVQTYTPEHYSILAAEEHDYEQFYKVEIENRKIMRYPPFSHLLRIVTSGTEENKVISAAQFLGEQIRLCLGNNEKVEILGPAPAPLSRLKGKYRWQMALKSVEIDGLRNIVNQAIRDAQQASAFNRVSLTIDVDPQGML